MGLQSPTMIEILGIKKIARFLGLAYFANGAGFLIGPPLAGT